jgi:hypothetical protein
MRGAAKRRHDGKCDLSSTHLKGEALVVGRMPSRGRLTAGLDLAELGEESMIDFERSYRSQTQFEALEH